MAHSCCHLGVTVRDITDAHMTVIPTGITEKGKWKYIHFFYILSLFATSADSQTVLQSLSALRASYLSKVWKAINLVCWNTAAGDIVIIICCWWCHISPQGGHRCGSDHTAGLTDSEAYHGSSIVLIVRGLWWLLLCSSSLCILFTGMCTLEE